MINHKVQGITVSSQEKGFLFLFAVVWTASPFLDLLRGAFLHLPGLSAFSDYVGPILVWSGILAGAPFVLKRLRMPDILLYLSISAIYFIHYLVYPENVEVLNFYAFTFLCIVVPQYFIGLVLNVPKFNSLILNLSRFVVILQFWYVFFYGAGAREAEMTGDSMMKAYAVLPHLLLVLSNLFNKRNWVDIFIVIIGLAQIFSFGNRGSMVAIVLFLLISVLQLPNSQLSKAWKLFISFLLGVAFIFLKQISLFFFNLISAFGMSARIFEKVIEGTFLVDESRMESYWKPLLEIIKNESFFGYGIGGDRVVGGVIYAHNIVLELLISFGVVFGAILFIWICIHIFRGFKHSADATSRNMVLVLVCSGFVPLFVSGTYLTATSFFLLLGVCTRNIRHIN